MTNFTDSHSDRSTQSPLRVLHVGPGWGQRGGIASVLGELETLNSRFQKDSISFAFFETHGFQNARNLLAFLTYDLPRFALTMTRGVDIVHFHVSVRGSFYRKLLLCALARLSGKQTIFHLHAGNFAGFESRAGRLTRRAVSWFLGGASATVAVSTAIGKEMLHLGADREKLRIIGNTACSAELVSRSALPRRPEEGSVPYVAFAGRLTEAKGLGELMKALALLTEQGCLIHLRLAGDGDISHWQRIACDYGISDRVIFAGWLEGEEKLALYRNARVFCMPSHYEAFGIATLEAMFSGVPIVGTRVGGFLDLVEDGATGYLIEPSDPEALAASLSRIVRAPDLAESMGKAGLARAQSRFSSEIVVDQYTECYREVATRLENTHV
jgi:glycosyltransferase involved in cell wall biosynthesis